MNFSSDNWSGVLPEISEALSRSAGGLTEAYGCSELDKRVEQRFNELFEREVAVYFVGTGTAANSLALAAVNRPGGVSFCHREAHVVKDECGAPEYFTGGARLQTVDGAEGRMDPGELKRELDRFPPGFVHAGQPMAVTLTQATEAGTVYAPEQIAELSAICRGADIPLHMDGARFANGLVALDVSPAEMTWKQGVDIVSFGATKNGCWCAEALVFLKPELGRQLPFIRKRAAQLFSKTRFIAAQFEAYLEDELWLRSARHANDMASRLRELVVGSEEARLAWETQTNEVFVIAPSQTVREWQEKGVGFYEWTAPRDVRGQIGEGETLLRLVTSFATRAEEVENFGRVLRGG